ncbi:hypothetical protein DPMN_015978 [Dreissena polymorpha]|uniref:Uncharacterized protein n=1 Tax=Dreissena polymorpha TaxID=45954 RepID=A0A9D4S633_DREPO|nr:hypothetical protein DPMN_015978 [Dreissena polymorpha]
MVRETVWHSLGFSCRCPDGLGTIVNALGVSCRGAAGLGDWQRRTLSGCLLQVPSWSGRPSETVADCLGLSYRYTDDLGTVADCLGVSLHGVWVPTKRQATSSRVVRGGLRSLDSMSNNTRSTDDRRSLLNPVIVARRLFAGTTIVARLWSLSLSWTQNSAVLGPLGPVK